MAASSQSFERSLSAENGVEDLVMLSEFTGAAIMETLKKRLERKFIYTYIGQVLISVNPYHPIENVLADRTIQTYNKRQGFELAPHIHALTQDAFSAMVQERVNQCVIISGESGAGKTEAAKLIMQYLARITKGTGVEKVKQVILDSNPVLEAFGNAKTIQNDNSSRFGKYFEILFNFSGVPLGGRITQYLLEKSRVVHQSAGERNYHIFYQLLAGAPALMAELHLRPPAQMALLNMGNSVAVKGLDDAKEFQDVVRGMGTLGLSVENQKAIWRVLAAILHLGELEIGGGDEAKIDDTSKIAIIADLLGVNPTALTNALITRTVAAGGGGEIGGMQEKEEEESPRTASRRHHTRR